MTPWNIWKEQFGKKTTLIRFEFSSATKSAAMGKRPKKLSANWKITRINSRFLYRRPAAGIDQGRLTAEANQVNGRITRRRQPFSSDLPEIFYDFHCSSSSVDPLYHVRTINQTVNAPVSIYK
jgi:hypothetical protein